MLIFTIENVASSHHDAGRTRDRRRRRGNKDGTRKSLN